MPFRLTPPARTGAAPEHASAPADHLDGPRGRRGILCRHPAARLAGAGKLRARGGGRLGG